MDGTEEWLLKEASFRVAPRSLVAEAPAEVLLLVQLVNAEAHMALEFSRISR